MTGVSRNPANHGSNVVYTRLRDRGYEGYAVNPNADEVEGDNCYADLKSVPVDLEWVVIGTKPETAEGTMHECVELGMPRVWMHRSFGDGSVSPVRHHLRAGTWRAGNRRWVPLDVRPDC